MEYHAHIYYHPEQKPFAEKLRLSLKVALGESLKKVSELFDAPLGPHPIPTFEIHFQSDHLAQVSDFLKTHHGAIVLDFGFFELIKTRPELRINQ